MPSIPRTHCRDPQELQLWSECHEAEGRALRLLELVRGLARSAEELGSAYATFMLQDVAPHAEKAVMTAGAARARCFRRGISDDARRRALEVAKRLGALPVGFDERTLPWKRTVASSLPPAPARTLSPSLPRDLVALCPGIVPSDPQMLATFVADRLARLDHRNGTRSGRPGPSQVWPGLVRHADGSPAVQGNLWMYSHSAIARQGTRFARPGGNALFLEVRNPGELEDYESGVLRSTVSIFGEGVAAAAEAGLRQLPVDLRVLGLLELEVECSRATAGSESASATRGTRAAEASTSYQVGGPKLKRTKARRGRG